MSITLRWVWVVLCISIVFPYEVFAGNEPVKLYLTMRNDESLIVYLQRVYVEGTPYSILKVNKRFNLGPTGGQGDLEFTISGIDGREYDMKAYINSISSRKHEPVRLEINELVGIVIPLGDIKNYFELPQGEYLVKGKYINSHTRVTEQNEFTGVIESESIRITIQ